MSIRVFLTEEADGFVKAQPDKVRKKITFNIGKVEGGIIDKELFEKLSGSDIWELRTLFNGSYYRLFAFWDKEEGALIVATHGIVKKTKKTPQREIAKAESIRKEYFNLKKGK